jgi:hypothetical protein
MIFTGANILKAQARRKVVSANRFTQSGESNIFISFWLEQQEREYKLIESGESCYYYFTSSVPEQWFSMIRFHFVNE